MLLLRPVSGRCGYEVMITKEQEILFLFDANNGYSKFKIIIKYYFYSHLDIGLSQFQNFSKHDIASGKTTFISILPGIKENLE